MKQILVIIIVALILIPGVNAEDDPEIRQTETTVHYGSKSVFLNYGYILAPGESAAFDLYPQRYLFLQFNVEENTTIAVTEIELTRVEISCPLVIDSNGSISNLSSYVAFCLSDGSVIFDYNMKNLYSYSYSNYDIWIEETFILYVANHENISLVTLLNLEFTYAFTYEVTRYIDPEPNQLEIMIICISLFCFALGIGIGWYLRGWHEEQERSY